MNKPIDEIEIILQALRHNPQKTESQQENECPSDELFGAFADGHIDGDEAEKLRGHIAGCSQCHLAYTMWQEIDKSESKPVPADLMKAAKALYKPSLTRIAVKLFKKTFELLNPGEISLSDSFQPAVEGVRRRQETLPEHHYEYVDIACALPGLDSLKIQLLEGTGLLKISLLALSTVADDKAAKLRIEVLRNDKRIQSWPVKEDGVELNPLAKGVYQIQLVAKVKSDSGGDGTAVLGSILLDLQD